MANAVKLLCFTMEGSAGCKELERSRVLEQFKKAHPEVAIEVLQVPRGPELEFPQKHGLTPRDVARMKEADARAEAFDVASLPSLLFVRPVPGGRDVELARYVGAPDIEGVERVYARTLTAEPKEKRGPPRPRA